MTEGKGADINWQQRMMELYSTSAVGDHTTVSSAVGDHTTVSSAAAMAIVVAVAAVAVAAPVLDSYLGEA
eukprot:gene2295-5665_t